MEPSQRQLEQAKEMIAQAQLLTAKMEALIKELSGPQQEELPLEN